MDYQKRLTLSRRTLIATSVLFALVMAWFLIHHIHDELILLMALAIGGAIYLGINLGLNAWLLSYRNSESNIDEVDDAQDS